MFCTSSCTRRVTNTQEALREEAQLNKAIQKALVSDVQEWQQVAGLVARYGTRMNYVTVALTVYKLGLLVRAGKGPTGLTSVYATGTLLPPHTHTPR